MSRSKSKGKTRSGASPRKKSEPTIYVCPYTDQNVYIQRATLADLKSKSIYHAGGRKRLWMLTSSQLRHELYAEAAQALASVEQSLLPSYGGRSWEVTCAMSEENGNILFRAWKGKMELAVLPHLLERIPDPPTWPGRKSRQLDEFFENENEEDPTNLQSREVSTLSSVAWDLRHQYPEPSVSIKWKSPDHRIFNSRKAAWDHAHEIAKREVFIDKHILGIGASGKLLQPTIPSGPTALKVGKLRFERDGLWVVNQELDWQEDRPELLQEIEEQKKQEGEEENMEEEAFDGTNKLGKEGNHNEAQETDVSRKRKLTPRSFFIQSQRHEYRLKKQQSMTGSKVTLRQAEAALRGVWNGLPADEQNSWKEKLAKHRVANCCRENSEHDPQRKSVELNTVTYFINARRHGYLQEKQQNLKTEKYTLRDAEHDLKEIWKQLSEEERIQWKERADASLATMSVVENVEYGHLPTGKNGQHKFSNTADPTSKKSKTLASDLVAQPKNNSSNSTVPHSVESASKSQIVAPLETNGQRSVTAEVQEASQSVNSLKTSEIKCLIGDIAPTTKPSHAIMLDEESNAQQKSKMEQKCTGDSLEFEEEKKEEESSVLNESGRIEVDGDITKAQEMSQSTSLAAIVPSAPPAVSDSVPNPPQFAPVAKQRAQRNRSSRRKTPTEKARQRWCLTDYQIDLCYEACMSHYEDVMRTVKTRDLVRELADGFDVLRERGRGRFDMELPAFDTATFSFLTDLEQTPWMPIVKAILGDNVTLIHKGCFLSMPEAETQVYHQDGLHLTTQTQRPCHAINVFVPLVDLTARNGPTEFCLGSHFLGNEGFDKDYAETPKPKAGTPVVFDYRLGHRGLGNSSTKCRPIVYCTYARGVGDGKEFRDSVNFSRKRYHRIGELTQKPLSREERRMNRKRCIENREVAVQVQKIARIEEEQKTPTPKRNECESEAGKAPEMLPPENHTNSPEAMGKPSTNAIVEPEVEAYTRQVSSDPIDVQLKTATSTIVQGP